MKVEIGNATMYLGDCMDILPTLDKVDAVITDPPYGMKKGDWDNEIPNWLPLVNEIPTAAFCGVIGMRDYPIPDWVGAWVRIASCQRNGRLQGFNNWEPILFFNIKKLSNDVISCPNIHENTGHPTTKPLPLMFTLIDRMPSGTILDPFMGSGTTGVAAIQLGRKFIGIEREPKYFEIACKRIEQAVAQGQLFEPEPVKPVQESMFD